VVLLGVQAVPSQIPQPDKIFPNHIREIAKSRELSIVRLMRAIEAASNKRKKWAELARSAAAADPWPLDRPRFRPSANR